MSKIIILVAVLLASTLVGTEGREGSDCLSGKREALIAGGFSGTLMCSGENVSLTSVGTTRSGYQIYDFRYRVMAAAVMHGGQRIVIFLGPDYIGQYALSPPPNSAIHVRGSSVIIRPEGPFSDVTTLDLANGPPSQALLEGHRVSLYR